MLFLLQTDNYVDGIILINNWITKHSVAASVKIVLIYLYS
jgi:hypothetical protein